MHFRPTLFIEFQVKYASSIATDGDSTSKDAASKSTLHITNDLIMCDEASDEVLETSGHIMTLHGLIVDASCINSKLHTALLCSNKRTDTTFGSSLGISIFQLYLFPLSLLIKHRSFHTG